jgi:hypothetical protein
MSNKHDVPFNLVRSHNVVGVKVTNPHNEDLGKVVEVVLDKITGQTCYVVLSFGGVLGMGDKYFALPWEAFKYDAGKDQFVLNVNKEKLKNAPGFEKNHWPDMAENSWGAGINAYYRGTINFN